MNHRSRGFTLVEILVVIGIVALIAALLFPAFASSKKEVNAAVDTSNLRQIFIANALYRSAHDDQETYSPSRLVRAGVDLRDVLHSPNDPSEIGIGNMIIRQAMHLGSMPIGSQVPTKYSYYAIEEHLRGVWERHGDQPNAGWLVAFRSPEFTKDDNRGLDLVVEWHRYLRLDKSGAVTRRNVRLEVVGNRRGYSHLDLFFAP